MAKKETLTFLGLPRCEPAALDGQQVAILGIAEASPYDFEKRSHSARTGARPPPIDRPI